MSLPISSAWWARTTPSRPRFTASSSRLAPRTSVSFRLLSAESRGRVSPESVRPEAWGDFLCAVFDEWVSTISAGSRCRSSRRRPGRPSDRSIRCAFFVRRAAISPWWSEMETSIPATISWKPVTWLATFSRLSLADLLESPRQRAFGLAKLEQLAGVCRVCEVREMCHGECPKNRFVPAPDGGRRSITSVPGTRSFSRM